MRNRNRFLPTLFEGRDTFVSSFDRVFDDLMLASFPDISREIGIDFFEKASYPKCNIYKSSSSLIIEASVPGLTKEDIEVKFDSENDVLTLSSKKIPQVDEASVPTTESTTASTTASTTESDKVYYLRELKKSSFKRSFKFVDKRYDFENADAKLENGILVITMKALEPEVKTTKDIAIN